MLPFNRSPWTAFVTVRPNSGGDSRGDRKQLNSRWTATLYQKGRWRAVWPLRLRARSLEGSGFVIVPDAFSEGSLGREAWREVKSSLSRMRTAEHPTALRIRAVQADPQWRRVPYEVDVPMSATRVEIWRTIHLVQHIATARFCRSNGDADKRIGVAVEPAPLSASWRVNDREPNRP